MDFSVNTPNVPASRRGAPGYVVIPSSGAIYSIGVACSIGLVSRDGARAGWVYIEDMPMRADALVDSGVLDQAAADYVAALEWCRNPQARATIAVTHAAPAPKPPPPSKAEDALVSGLNDYLVSAMDTDARQKLIEVFRGAVRDAVAQGR